VLLEPEFEVFDFYQKPTGELDEPSKGEVHDDLVVLHPLPAFHRTEISQQAVTAIAHAGKTAVFEVRHSVRMHRREVPSIMATPLPSPALYAAAPQTPAETDMQEYFRVSLPWVQAPGAASKAADLGGGRPLPSIAHSDG
jgi:hypothetical protein